MTKKTASELAKVKHDETGWLITYGDAELHARDSNMLAILCGTLMVDDVNHRKELRRLEKELKSLQHEANDDWNSWEEKAEQKDKRIAELEALYEIVRSRHGEWTDAESVIDHIKHQDKRIAELEKSAE